MLMGGLRISELAGFLCSMVIRYAAVLAFIKNENKIFRYLSGYKSNARFINHVEQRQHHLLSTNRFAE